MLLDKRSRILARVYEAIVLTVAALFAIAADAQNPGPAVNPDGSIISQEDKHRIEEYIRRSKPSVGLIFGTMEVPGNQAAGMMEVDASFELMQPISLGLSYALAGAGAEHTRGALLGKLAYNFRGYTPILRYAWLGINAGWVHDEGKHSGAIAPVLGFDQPLQRHWSVGVQSRYLLTLADGSEDAFSIGGVLKYWF